MKAVYFTEHGGRDQLIHGEFPSPQPGPGESMIRVKACALNHLDIWVRIGIPGLEIPLPHIPGSDVAGIEEGTGRRVLVAPGLSCGACPACAAGNDHLCPRFDILGQKSNGGYAEAVVVPTANVLPIPDGLKFEEAASLPLVFLTAWHMLVANGDVQSGQTVLVHAGGSGVGIAAIQIAKLRGAGVITTVGSTDKAVQARALGADEVILYREKDFLEEVRRWTNGRGVDLVVEHIGQETFEKSLLSLAPGGRLLTCGATSGRQIAFDLRSLFGRNITIHGSRMGRRQGLLEVLDHVQSGRLKPVVDSTLPLERAAEAQARMENRENFGKIVLTC